MSNRTKVLMPNFRSTGRVKALGGLLEGRACLSGITLGGWEGGLGEGKGVLEGKGALEGEGRGRGVSSLEGRGVGVLSVSRCSGAGVPDGPGKGCQGPLSGPGFWLIGPEWAGAGLGLEVERAVRGIDR